MAIACPSCGTQNPDGNKFCQSCGKPLAAATPVAAASAASTPAPPTASGGATPPPPPAPAPPGGPQAAPAAPAAPPPGQYAQPGYSPYYQPGQPTPVHRTPWGLIIGVVVGLLVLMGGCGVVIAAVAAHPNPNPSPVAHNTSTPTPAPTTAPTSAPTGAPTSAPTVAPTATPRATPTPTPQPTSRPPSGQGTVTTQSFSLSAPGWKVVKQDQYSATLLGPQQDGALFVQAGPLGKASSTTAEVQAIAQAVGQKYPDAKVCVKPGNESIGGKPGQYFGACYTFTPQNGKAFVAADYYWVAVDSANNIFEYEVFTPADNFDGFYNRTALSVINSIQWAV